MEVSKHGWKELAVKNITKYVHRGGENEGDKLQLLGGADLLNTIGVAMGLPTTNPENWTRHELEKALRGELVYFEKEARQAIDVVAKQIRSCCGGDDKNFVTVLPVEVYFGGKLYELPLFRVQRYKDSQRYYIDNVGRSYDSVSDWYNNSKLPPAEMAYPTNLRLSLGGNERARVSFADTPLGRLDSKAGRCIDTVAAVAGLTSSVALIFASGGLAAPLVGTALVSAGWGTGRAGYQLVDKASHGETVNPFTDSESRMLWLGIAASITSFGAMGATMRLSSLAARGRDISNALRVVTNCANGTNLAVSTLATLNSTIYMINHFDELSGQDIVMQLASIAFWSRGVFTYKTASMIISDARNQAFAALTKDLSNEQKSQFSELRNRVQNDAQLLQRFYAAMETNVHPKTYSQLLIDGLNYHDAVSALTQEQMDAFDSLRLYVKDDARLISGLNRVADRYNLSPTETIERVLNMWQQMSASGNNEAAVILKGGNLYLGSAPPIKIDQLQQLSPQLIKFFGEHLSRIDAATSGQWSSSVPVLLKLQGQGMFQHCPAIRVLNAGRAVISLNGQLKISIHKLNAMMPGDTEADRAKYIEVFKMIKGLPSDALVESSQIPPALIKFCVVDHRLRFECHRQESVDRAAAIVQRHPSLLQLIRADLQSFEKDRLYTFVAELEMYTGENLNKNLNTNYLNPMLEFVAEMKPKTISNLVAYSEFVMACVDNERNILKDKIDKGQLTVPDGEKKKKWMSKFFRDFARMASI